MIVFQDLWVPVRTAGLFVITRMARPLCCKDDNGEDNVRHVRLWFPSLQYSDQFACMPRWDIVVFPSNGVMSDTTKKTIEHSPVYSQYGYSY